MHTQKKRPATGRRNRLASTASLPQRVQNLKASLPPVLFYIEEFPGWTPRQEHGWTEGGLCSFHADKTAGSFKVNLDSGAFKCFSCGAAGGDIISYYRLRYCLDFMAALRDLEGRAGIWQR